MGSGGHLERARTRVLEDLDRERRDPFVRLAGAGATWPCATCGRATSTRRVECLRCRSGRTGWLALVLLVGFVMFGLGLWLGGFP